MIKPGTLVFAPTGHLFRAVKGRNRPFHYMPVVKGYVQPHAVCGISADDQDLGRVRAQDVCHRCRQLAGEPIPDEERS